MSNTAVLTAMLVAAFTTASPRPIHVEVDVSELGPDGTGVDGLVLDALGPKLEAAGFTLAAEPGEAIALRVRFEALRLDKFDYGVHFEIVDGDQVAPALQWVACLACMDAKLLPLLDEQGPALIEALEQLERAGTAAEVEAADPPLESDPPLDSTPIAPIGPLGHAGIGVAALGLGVTIVGAVEVSRGVVVEPDQTSYDLRGTDHRPAGYALVGIGAATTLIGAVLIGVDVGRRAKQRARGPNEAAQLVPIVGLVRGRRGPAEAGRFGFSLGLAGRF